MKFAQLPIGARFRYQGRPYSKVSPLAASAEDGTQRIIPRSATVEALDSVAPPPVEQPDALQRALDIHHAACRELLAEASSAGPDGLAVLQQRLDASYAALLRSIA